MLDIFTPDTHEAGCSPWEMSIGDATECSVGSNEGERPPYSIFTYECPGDGIGIRVGLRSQILRVRVSPWAPYRNALDPF